MNKGKNCKLNASFGYTQIQTGTRKHTKPCGSSAIPLRYRLNTLRKKTKRTGVHFENTRLTAFFFTSSQSYRKRIKCQTDPRGSCREIWCIYPDSGCKNVPR